jgi:cytochrome b561
VSDLSLSRFRNSASEWGSIAIALHWTIVLMAVVQIPLGFWMVDLYEAWSESFGDDTWVMRTSLLHHTLGFFVLFAAALRVSWRLANPPPAWPAATPRWRRVAARANHICLYLLLLIYPLSGWASLSAYEGEFPIFFLWIDEMPRIVPQVPEGSTFAYEFFAGIHRFCWKVGGGLLALHVGAALWHGLIARDGVLARMLPGTLARIRPG